MKKPKISTITKIDFEDDENDVDDPYLTELSQRISTLKDITTDFDRDVQANQSEITSIQDIAGGLFGQ